ncbi:Septin-10, partial [Fasciola gigantica]
VRTFQILSEIQSNEINIYQFPTDDETVSDVNTKMNQHVPFRGCPEAGKRFKINGKNARVRQYPWGAVQVDNESHCDFVRLREMFAARKYGKIYGSVRTPLIMKLIADNG